MGPLISADHRETVASYVPEDAPVAIRGAAPEGSGFWYPPTVLAPLDERRQGGGGGDLRPGRRRDPVRGRRGRRSAGERHDLRPLRFDLDGERAPAPCASRGASRPAYISMNSNTSVRVATPFGGMKQSGVGRELGPHALDYYTEIKNVYVSTEED